MQKLDPHGGAILGFISRGTISRELVLAPTPAAMEPIYIIDPEGRQVDCDPHLSDGVIVVEARPLIERLGFRVEYNDGPPMTMRILRSPFA